MNEIALIGFVWNAISGDAIVNAAYDGVKAILGKGFNRLASYAKENKKNDFEIAQKKNAHFKVIVTFEENEYEASENEI